MRFHVVNWRDLHHQPRRVRHPGAIRHSAPDYLLKPIKPSEFDAALGHFIANCAMLPARVERLVSTAKEAGAPKTLVIPYARRRPPHQRGRHHPMRGRPQTTRSS
ncbi:MAG: hypothetical protein IPJ85_16270, partial [Flavobacteriales bacterium]|nr:hypothetical protein [Flavobacteriales bacterium]